MTTVSDEVVRACLAELLQSGLKTQWRERAYTSAAINAVAAQLRSLDANDYAGKLAVAGFTEQPYVADDEEIAQACETCMYYSVHRQFCELPELSLPVNPHWSCRLWRI